MPPAINHLRQCHILDSCRCCFTARGDWAILTTTVHDRLARLQLDCGGLLNVKALYLPLLSFSAFTSGWIIRSQCVSLPRLLFLLCQAGTLPGLSLRFVNVCFVHLETNIREHTKWNTAQTRKGGVLVSLILQFFRRTCPQAASLPCKLKYCYFNPKRWESQVSADNQNHHTTSCLFIWHL